MTEPTKNDPKEIAGAGTTARRVCAVMPGSYDPVTKGHERLIARAACLYDTVTVLVCVNGEKKGMFSPSERTELLEAVCRKYPNVRVERWDGLLMTYLASHPADVIVRGARGAADYDYEASVAAINREMCRTDTVIFPTEAEVAHISSTYARDLLRFGGDVSPALPPEAAEILRAKEKGKSVKV